MWQPTWLLLIDIFSSDYCRGRRVGLFINNSIMVSDNSIS